MHDTAIYRNEDLVLPPRRSVNPERFDISRYEPFLDALCADREYQKEAIRNVCNYLFGGEYANTRELAEDNWNHNPHLKEKYSTVKRLASALQLPEKLSCSVDLATGTGKSYAMYAVARIALCEGVVTRVLLLCPSNTIESGLFDKFRSLTSDTNLTDLLPESKGAKIPSIIDADGTITTGSICIENIHATYKATRSAVRESLMGRGSETLVLNDEAHHIFSKSKDQALKKWKEFLESDEFVFSLIANFSGTCYVGNDYFTDVIYRYSLRQAIEDGFVKSINYIVEDSPGSTNEKWQKIHKNHEDAKAKYSKVRPLTIVITSDIHSCKNVTDELSAFLSSHEKISLADAQKKVMRVHTPRASGIGAKEDKEVARNISRLRRNEPDSETSQIEWITSVSMLTEGWDVQNVFQIYPHEKRAFDSKLLIAQVLGRGLRVPAAYAGQRPTVTVYNHDSWSGKIKNLVNEVLEIERRVQSFAVDKDPDYHFDIHHIDYTRSPEIVETDQESEYDFDMDYVQLAAQSKHLDRETEYENASLGKRTTKKTRVTIEMFPIDDVTQNIRAKFKAIDLESGTNYAKTYSEDKITSLIKESLRKIGYEGDEVSKENRQRILSAFGNLKRPGNKSIRYVVKPSSVIKINTKKRPVDSLGISSLRRGASVFYDELSKSFDTELEFSLSDLENDDMRPVKALFYIDNRYYFKTGLSVVLTPSDPEYRFVKSLVQQENASCIDAWFKNADSNFYGIEYSYSKGEYSRRGTFNPDYFLKTPQGIVVVEIKDDKEIDDPSAENIGKRREAMRHFALLNNKQNELQYHFCFLTPKDYDLFFAQLRDGNILNFQSNLDVALIPNQ